MSVMQTNVSSIENNEIITGTIWKQILKFFFPIFFGTLFQMLYNTVDAVVVGRVLGKEALAAVGGGTAVIVNLLLGLFIGLSSGATVIISQYFGANEPEKVSTALHNAFALAVWGGIAVSIIGFVTIKPMLTLIDTPLEVLDPSIRYMKIYYSGAIIVVMFNIGTGIYRAFGDSKSPLYFLIIGCFTNIVLDILCVKILGMGIEGAAYATVFSQAVSLFFVVYFLKKKQDCCHLSFRKIKFDKYMLKRTIAIGLPSAIQSVLFSVSNLLIQSGINRFGTDTAAAWSAYGKLDVLFWMIVNAFGISITTFAGQNFGAGQIERVKKGTKQCILMAMGATVVLEILYMTVGKYGYLLFISDSDVIEIGLRILSSIAPFFFTYVIGEILSGTMRGAGKTLVPTLIVVSCICIFRAIWLAVIPKFNSSLEALLSCYAISWVMNTVFLIIYYKLGNIFGEKH